MERIAFYAPLKSPGHPVPSGDRELATGILAALTHNTLGLEVELVSHLRCYDGQGDARVQRQLLTQADQEIERILIENSRSENHDRSWRAWVTYHNYYKAPDLIGPVVCKQLRIPYILIEASIAMHRRSGPWADFARRSDLACAQADIILYLTERDRPALVEHQRTGQEIVHFPPFLNQTALPETDVGKTPPSLQRGRNILAVGMLRPGDKFKSYQIIADVLSRLHTPAWRLTVIGDGESRGEIESLFERFTGQVTFLGQLDRAGVTNAYRDADVFLWPGVNEAFGMVYLEAQAMGLPVVAEDRPGVQDVVAAANTLVPVNDHARLAQQVDRVLASADLHKTLATAGRRFISDGHLLDSAAAKLSNHLSAVISS